MHSQEASPLSSGTVYSLSYSLERDGLIEGKFNNRKRVYALTEKGEETIRELQETSEQIQTYTSNLLKRLNNNTRNSKEEVDTVVYSD